MWCHQLCLKKNGFKSWALSFVCVHTDETVRRSHENPCWLDRCTWSQMCFILHHLQMEWEIQSWKSQLWRWSPSGSSSIWQEQTVLFVKKITEEDPHTPIRGKCERCDFSVSIAKKNCARWSHREKTRGKIDTSSPNRPAKDTESWMFKGLAQTIWTRWTQTPFATSSQAMKLGCTIMASLTNGPIRCGFLLTGRDQLCFD